MPTCKQLGKRKDFKSLERYFKEPIGSFDTFTKFLTPSYKEGKLRHQIFSCLWAHKCFQVFPDKFTTDQDKKIFADTVTKVIKETETRLLCSFISGIDYNNNSHICEHTSLFYLTETMSLLNSKILNHFEQNRLQERLHKLAVLKKKENIEIQFSLVYLHRRLRSLIFNLMQK